MRRRRLLRYVGTLGVAGGAGALPFASGARSASGSEPDAVIGERVERPLLALVVRDVYRITSLGSFQTPDEGNEFVVVRVAVKNVSEESLSVSTFFQMRLVDDQQFNYSPSLWSTDQPFPQSDLVPGEVARGDVVFEVPRDASGFEFQFDFSSATFGQPDRVEVDLNTRAETISDLGQDLGVPVHRPADTVSDGVAVTLNDVGFVRRIGEFARAALGREFAVVDVTVEATTDAAETVSMFLQSAIKDGIGRQYDESIVGTSQLSRQYVEGTPLAPGEQRRGRIAYEVEQVPENLYWTFDFTVFDPGQKAFWQLR